MVKWLKNKLKRPIVVNIPAEYKLTIVQATERSDLAYEVKGWTVQYRQISEIQYKFEKQPYDNKYKTVITGFKKYGEEQISKNPWYTNSHIYSSEAMAKGTIRDKMKSSSVPIYEYRIVPLYFKGNSFSQLTSVIL